MSGGLERFRVEEPAAQDSGPSHAHRWRTAGRVGAFLIFAAFLVAFGGTAHAATSAASSPSAAAPAPARVDEGARTLAPRPDRDVRPPGTVPRLPTREPGRVLARAGIHHSLSLRSTDVDPRLGARADTDAVRTDIDAARGKRLAVSVTRGHPHAAQGELPQWSPQADAASSFLPLPLAPRPAAPTHSRTAGNITSLHVGGLATAVLAACTLVAPPRLRARWTHLGSAIARAEGPGSRPG